MATFSVAECLKRRGRRPQCDGTDFSDDEERRKEDFSDDGRDAGRSPEEGGDGCMMVAIVGVRQRRLTNRDSDGGLFGGIRKV